MTNYTKLSGKTNEFISMAGLSADRLLFILIYMKQ